MLFGSNGSLQPKQEDELSVEDRSLIMEAALLEAAAPEELQAFLENHNEVNAAIRDEVLLEKTIVRLDKKARLTRAEKVAVFAIAKQKNDIDFKKLMTVWRMERYLEGRLMKKYGAQGMRVARQTMQNASKKSKSPTIKKVTNRITSELSAAKGPAPAALSGMNVR
jgi:hypothetical protein